ncbi:MAG: hypothetical protein C4K49_04245 [Candidatus Thorarchaeota archaeon]|nr:MAG: hypothetical protein C4K49_04245 [Candidatus Thorarchaeota archaeon]
MPSSDETLPAIVERAEEVLIVLRSLPARVKSLEERLGILNSLERIPPQSGVDNKSQVDRPGVEQTASLLGLLRGMIDRLELETEALELRVKALEVSV